MREPVRVQCMICGALNRAPGTKGGRPAETCGTECRTVWKSRLRLEAAHRTAAIAAATAAIDLAAELPGPAAFLQHLRAGRCAMERRTPRLSAELTLTAARESVDGWAFLSFDDRRGAVRRIVSRRSRRIRPRLSGPE